MTWAERSLIRVLSFIVLTQTLCGALRQAPDPREVYDIIRTNLPDLTDAQLQTAAVDGLVKELAPRVWIAGNQPTNGNSGPALTKVSVFDGPIGYLRIAAVENGLDRMIRAAYTDLSSTNALKGVVLDLRFAEGGDYQAAASSADLFLAKEQPLLNWGTGSAKATEKTNALRTPVVVLVNQLTSASAEALAGALRDSGIAILIGTNTAGHAMMTEDFTLNNGQHLLVARAGIKLGSGAVLSAAGLKPDIEVAINPQDEKAYWAEPYGDLSSANRSTGVLPGAGGSGVTNTVARRRINEAELFRERRGSVDLPGGAVGRTLDPETDVPLVRDPALARALDLIKGLAVVRQRHD